MRKIKERICRDIKNLWPAAAAVVVSIILSNIIFHAFCPMVVLTGIPCPGCGMTRSLFLLLTGRVGLSVRMHPMGLPVACIILYFMWNRYILGRMAKGIKFMIVLVIVLLIALYCIRMYQFFLYREPYVYMEDNILAKILPFYEQILHSLKIL